MGGLIIRQYLANHNLPLPQLGGPEVERIFTIGSPYLGSNCADVFQFQRADLYELTTNYQRSFDARLPFSFNSASIAAYSTPVEMTCGEQELSDSVVGVLSATRYGFAPSRSLLSMVGSDPGHTDQTRAAGLFNKAIAPNTIGIPLPPEPPAASLMATSDAAGVDAGSDWNTGSGSSSIPGGGGCATTEIVRVPVGTVALSLLSDGTGTTSVTAPGGATSVAQMAAPFSGTTFAPAQAGAWTLQICSASGGATATDWSAMVSGSQYTHEILDVVRSGNNQLIPVRVGVATGAAQPVSASYVLSSPTQSQSGQLALADLLQNGSNVPIDTSLFAGEKSLQLEISLSLPDGVVLRTISTVANDAIFASSFE
jgi:hypothetical protein